MDNSFIEKLWPMVRHMMATMALVHPCKENPWRGMARQVRGNAPRHFNGCMKDNRDELNLVANLHGKATPPHFEVFREHAKAQKSLFASAFPKCTVKLQKGSKLTAIAAAS